MKKKLMQFLMSKGIYRIAYSGKERTLFITVDDIENDMDRISIMIWDRFPILTFNTIYQTN